ncbi:hypothetical protein CB1_001786002 [Camelus ferus]|nr:hypothetical protein CB1_001786002 [Camelus ferus]
MLTCAVSAAEEGNDAETVLDCRLVAIAGRLGPVSHGWDPTSLICLTQKPGHRKGPPWDPVTFLGFDEDPCLVDESGAYSNPLRTANGLIHPMQSAQCISRTKTSSLLALSRLLENVGIFPLLYQTLQNTQSQLSPDACDIQAILEALSCSCVMEGLTQGLLLLLAGLPVLEANDVVDKDSPFYYGTN